MQPRVGAVEPSCISQQYQKVGIHEIGNHRGQVVVVTEATLHQFLYGYHIVLVHDAHHSHVAQRQQCVACVQVSGPVGKTVPRQQRLGNCYVSFVKQRGRRCS